MDATFPILHQHNEIGQPVSAPHGALPSMHSFRHTVASRALLAGESIDEVAFLLGHRDAFARPRVSGAALATTPRTNVCAASDSATANPSPAITAPTACSLTASSSRTPARSLAVWSLATTTMIREWKYYRTERT